jgi:hypothetical protein
MQTAALTIVRTGTECAAYRLTDATGRVVWSNRVYDRPEGHKGARERLAAWAVTHGYKVVEQREKVKQRA